MDKYKAAYLRMKLSAVLSFGFFTVSFVYLVVPHAFNPSLDSLYLFAVELLIFLAVCRGLGFWMYRKERLLLSRFLIAGIALTFFTLFLLVLISLGLGTMEWGSGLAEIEIGNLAQVCFLLVLTYACSVAFFGWKVQSRISKERKIALREKQEALLAKEEACRQLAKLDSELNELRLSYISQEMNPHFLSNSLATVKILGNMYPEKAVEAMTILTTIYRAYLQHRKQHMIPLREEITQIKNVLLIYELTKMAPLYFTIDVSKDELHELRIPMMMIMNLVENCYKYGRLTDAASPALLNIDTTSDGALRILVENECAAKVVPEAHQYSNGLSQLRDRLWLLHPTENSAHIQIIDRRFCIKIIMRPCSA